jgi:hypothetical protein
LPPEGARQFCGRFRDSTRCPWTITPAYVAYHDTEWGVPQHDDRVLFEILLLRGAAHRYRL